MYFVSPYFYPDAFMHHTMHVLDAPDALSPVVFLKVQFSGPSFSSSTILHSVDLLGHPQLLEAIIISRILYAAPTWWGLTQASDILKIYKLQRKVQRIEYASHDDPRVEIKVHQAEERLFRKITVEDDHVLKQYLPQNNAITYNLRPRPHNILLPPKDDSLFITRMLYRKSIGKE